ncbi:hypothetical protein RP20_CCG008042 [Aedes albopictus]|nr:hypothetical protein RP20_CCG008042 [Aedes albopictus]
MKIKRESVWRNYESNSLNKFRKQSTNETPEKSLKEFRETTQKSKRISKEILAEIPEESLKVSKYKSRNSSGGGSSGSGHTGGSDIEKLKQEFHPSSSSAPTTPLSNVAQSPTGGNDFSLPFNKLPGDVSPLHSSMLPNVIQKMFPGHDSSTLMRRSPNLDHQSSGWILLDLWERFHNAHDPYQIGSASFPFACRYAKPRHGFLEQQRLGRTVYGPRGKLSKSFRHLDIYKVSKKKLMVEKWFGAKNKIVAVRTVCSHIDL